MQTRTIPGNYAQWRYCIEVECGITLTRAFAQERLAVWRDAQCAETQRFRALYGDEHLRQVIAWFERAEQELAAESGSGSGSGSR